MTVEPRSFLRDPNQFGTSKAVWHPDQLHDPLDVATAYLSHRIAKKVLDSMAVREVSSKDLAKAVGAEDSRNVDRKLSGQRHIHLRDLVGWSLFLGVSPANIAYPHQVHPFPKEYSEWLAGWTPGQGTLPHFRKPPSTLALVVWEELANSFNRQVQSLHALGLLDALKPEIVRHFVLRALVEQGVIGEDCFLGEADLDIVVRGPQRSLARVFFTPLRAVSLREVDAAQEEFGKALMNLCSDTDHHDRILLSILNSKVARAITQSLPSLTGGGLVVFPWEQLDVMVSNGSPGDIEAEVLSHTKITPGGFTLYVLKIGKLHPFT